MKNAVIIEPTPQTVETITCSNCGHVVEKDPLLRCVSFRWINPTTSCTTCGNCGIMTLQQAYDESFSAGQFLIIRPYNTIRKGNIRK